MDQVTMELQPMHRVRTLRGRCGCTALDVARIDCSDFVAFICCLWQFQFHPDIGKLCGSVSR